ncbi:MAG: sulfite exporter TauE/SafE family protein [Sedimentisphaerales bacterium]|nr:sulfite exporter TauE/SafE family protein [Sedimentisphaerales bacterium]
MDRELGALVITAAWLGFLHTVLGPDHYLPFIMISWARKWSSAKTAVITFLCGIGHIASSVVLGLVGVSLGLVVRRLEIIESFRGNIAAWLMIGFGLAYMVWGLRRAYRKQSHSHSHFHVHSEEHAHTHSHLGDHAHVHDGKAGASITPWALFIVFVFGPCEVLIPILMYPAAEKSFPGVLLVTAVFATATIGTMLGIVLLSRAGVNFLPLAKLERFTHAIAGATICCCGLAIQLLGL